MKSVRISIGGFGRLTKYLAISCLSLALISTISLNLYRTYSSSNTETNAIDGNTNSELATQANIDPTSISLSITSYPSSSTGGNDANLSLSIPQGGGIATGRHTVTVETGSSVIVYDLMLSSDSEETSLVNGDNVDNEENDSGSIIPTTTGILTSPSQLADKSYGYTLANLDNDSSLANTNIWIGLKPSTSPDTITTVDDSNLTIGQANTTRHNICYGVNIQNPVETRAGDYTRQVVYTVVGELMPEPTVDSITPNTYALDSGEGLDENGQLRLTIQGNNLDAVEYGELSGGNPESEDYDMPISCNVISSTQLTCFVQVPKEYDDMYVGPYDLTLFTSYGEITLESAFKFTSRSICRSNSSVSACQVDIDDNMIPIIVYDKSNGLWQVISDEEMRDYPGAWYDYGHKQWANAITLRDDYRGGYLCHGGDTTTIGKPASDGRATCPSGANPYTPLEYAKALKEGAFYGNDDIGTLARLDLLSLTDGYGGVILGYWVYIPRYAYQVMRRDATDKVVTDEEAIAMGGFNIKFETNKDTKKVPVACNSSNSNQYYQDCPGVGNTYGNATGTSWATHPAFTWGDTELNGFWIGKFETTGSTSQPTVLPNQKHMSQSSGNIGDMYNVAKSIGVEDKNNVYGNSAQTSYNNGKGYHNLAISTSHMLKNSEWGAVAYLSASRYGAGVNNVQINANASSGYDGNGDSSYGVTGCGPDGSSQYNTGNGQLASTTNNIYGVYDMAGGAYEYVMGSYTNDSTQSYPSNDYIVNKVKPPYVDLYVNPPFNGNEDTNNNLCTWTTCGGYALFETAGWGDDYSYFVYSSNPWFLRGGYANADSAGTGVFYSGVSNGRTLGSNSFRVGLAALSVM